MSVQRISLPGQPTRIVDEGPASVSVDAFSAMGALSASAIRETVPGANGGSGPSVRSLTSRPPSGFDGLIRAAETAARAWDAKATADAAWSIASAALTAAMTDAARVLAGEPVASPEPVTQADRDATSRKRGQAAMRKVVAKKGGGYAGRTHSPETKERMRQAALARHAAKVTA